MFRIRLQYSYISERKLEKVRKECCLRRKHRVAHVLTRLVLARVKSPYRHGPITLSRADRPTRAPETRAALEFSFSGESVERTRL